VPEAAWSVLSVARHGVEEGIRDAVEHVVDGVVEHLMRHNRVPPGGDKMCDNKRSQGYFPRLTED
jgi:hypothetical protein